MATIQIQNPCTDSLPIQLNRLFDRFYRADPARRETGEGAGLGLAITRSIAQAHGGDVTASACSEGICLVMKLPVS
jgi:two-component system heavy metal sensor histidine kinase CusS